VKVWVWTGYKLEQLKSISVGPRIKDTLELCEGIVEGPFILAERDITLPMRGSRNQRILYTKDLDLDTFEIKENL
jgi:anaerobic ribonucleoside-triphosphate reductase activating protein